MSRTEKLLSSTSRTEDREILEVLRIRIGIEEALERSPVSGEELCSLIDQNPGAVSEELFEVINGIEDENIRHAVLMNLKENGRHQALFVEKIKELFMGTDTLPFLYVTYSNLFSAQEIIHLIEEPIIESLRNQGKNPYHGSPLFFRELMNAVPQENRLFYLEAIEGFYNKQIYKCKYAERPERNRAYYRWVSESITWDDLLSLLRTKRTDIFFDIASYGYEIWHTHFEEQFGEDELELLLSQWEQQQQSCVFLLRKLLQNSGFFVTLKAVLSKPGKLSLFLKKLFLSTDIDYLRNTSHILLLCNNLFRKLPRELIGKEDIHEIIAEFIKCNVIEANVEMDDSYFSPYPPDWSHIFNDNDSSLERLVEILSFSHGDKLIRDELFFEALNMERVNIAIQERAEQKWANEVVSRSRFEQKLVNQDRADQKLVNQVVSRAEQKWANQVVSRLKMQCAHVIAEQPQGNLHEVLHALLLKLEIHNVKLMCKAQCDDGYKEAAASASQLNEQFEKIRREYLLPLSRGYDIDFQAFKESCLQAVNEAEGVFKNHRLWRGKCLHFFFREYATDSTRQLQVFRQELNEILGAYVAVRSDLLVESGSGIISPFPRHSRESGNPER